MSQDRYFGTFSCRVRVHFQERKHRLRKVRKRQNLRQESKICSSGSVSLFGVAKERILPPIRWHLIPPEGQPVQLEVVKELDYTIGVEKKSRWPYVKVKLKIYDSWKLVNIRRILEKRNVDIYGFLIEKEPGLLTVDDVLHTLQAPFKGDPFYIDLLTQGLAVFVHSSPPWWGTQGGVLEGALGKKKHFSVLRYVIDLIPSEFRRRTSKYYYNLTKEHNEIPPPSAIEANLCYLNPESYVHLPLPLTQEWVTTQSKKDYAKRFEDAKLLMRSRIIDSLLIQPTPENERVLMKATQEVIDLARDEGLPCPIELGGAIPRISSGLARMGRKFELDKRTVSQAVTLF